MKPIIFIASALAVFVAAAADHTSNVVVSITAHYPRKLSSLFLRGSACGLSWEKGLKMTQTATAAAGLGVQDAGSGHYMWNAEVGCNEKEIAMGPLEVKVLVDDKDWMLGSNHHIAFPSQSSADANDASQQQNSTYSSSSENMNGDLYDDMYPWFYTYKGSLSKIEKVYSSELKNTRDIIYYTPPSYAENTLKVHKNLLVMHDGQNLFNPLTSAFGTAWMCQDTLDELIMEGAMDEIVVAGAYNTADRIDEYTYIYDPSEGAGGKGDLYLDWIESTLIPTTLSAYRVSVERERLGILGSSLGGLISCYAGWTRPAIYGKVGCMSSSFWWDDNDFQKNVITSQNPSNGGNSLPIIYVDSGTGSLGEKECTLYSTQIVEYAEREEVGYVEDETIFQFVAQGGTHDEASWSARFDQPMRDLYPANTV